MKPTNILVVLCVGFLGGIAGNSMMPASAENQSEAQTHPQLKVQELIIVDSKGNVRGRFYGMEEGAELEMNTPATENEEGVNMISINVMESWGARISIHEDHGADVQLGVKGQNSFLHLNGGERRDRKASEFTPLYSIVRLSAEPEKSQVGLGAHYGFHGPVTPRIILDNPILKDAQVSLHNSQDEKFMVLQTSENGKGSVITSFSDKNREDK